MADRETSSRARDIVAGLSSSFEAHHEAGEIFLKNYPRSDIGICYLDAFDIMTQDGHSDAVHKTYLMRNLLMTNSASYAMHCEAAAQAMVKMVPGGFICFDDVWLDRCGVWQGKGKTAIPLLLSSGYRVIRSKNNALLLQNLNGLDPAAAASGRIKEKLILLELKILKRRIQSIPRRLAGMLRRARS